MLNDFKTTKNNHKSYQSDENMSDKRWEFNGNGDRSQPQTCLIACPQVMY